MDPIPRRRLSVIHDNSSNDLDLFPPPWNKNAPAPFSVDSSNDLDLFPPRWNKNAPAPFSVVSSNDLNRMKNLTLQDSNQMLNYVGGLKKPSLGGDGSMPLKPNPAGNLPYCYSPTAPCMCGGEMHHFGERHEAWSFSDQKLYSAVEDPTHKKYSPSLRPVESTSYSTSNLRNLLANFN